MRLQASTWLADQRAYQRAMRRAERAKGTSIRRGISRMIKRMIKFYQKEAQKIQEHKKKELRESLRIMQNGYNKAFEKDKTEGDQLLRILNDPQLNKWMTEEKDKDFLDKAILQHL